MLIMFFFRDVSTEEGQHKATEHEMLFVETSAKAGTNIKMLFNEIAAALIPGGVTEQKESFKLTEETEAKKDQEQQQQQQNCSC